MPDISEGLTTGPAHEPTISELEATTRPRTVDVTTDAEIKAGILSSEGSVRTGLTVAPDPELQEYNDWRNSPGGKAQAAEWDALHQQEAADAAELAERRFIDARDEALLMVASFDDAEVFDGWSRLRALGATEYAIEQGWVDLDSREELDAGATLFGLTKVAMEMQAAVERNNAAAVEDRQARFQALAQANGWSEEEALRRVYRAAEIARAAGGDLARLQGQDWTDAVVGGIASEHELQRASAVSDFQNAVLGADDRSISSGLTQASPFGHQPVNPRPFIPARPDFARVERVVNRDFETPEEIRQSVASESSAQAEYKAVMAKGRALFGE